MRKRNEEERERQSLERSLKPIEPFEPLEPLEPLEPIEPLEPLERIEPLESLTGSKTKTKINRNKPSCLTCGSPLILYVKDRCLTCLSAA